MPPQVINTFELYCNRFPHKEEQFKNDYKTDLTI